MFCFLSVIRYRTVIFLNEKFCFSEGIKHEKTKNILKIIPHKTLHKKSVNFVSAFFRGGGKHLEAGAFFTTFIGTIAFNSVSSAIYIINDIKDRKQDSMHPTKRKRPIASGDVSVQEAKIISLLLLLLTGGLLYAAKAEGAACFCCVIYLFINLAYSFGLKNVPILDITLLGAGYLIRVLFGGFLAGIPVSAWLFLTVLCVSFYLGFGKRKGELEGCMDRGDNAASLESKVCQQIVMRPVLEKYTLSYLDNHMNLCLGLGVVFYSLWAMEKSIILVYTVPLVLFICMKYDLVLTEKADGDPVNTIFASKSLLILLVLYIGIIAFILYILL